MNTRRRKVISAAGFCSVNLSVKTSASGTKIRDLRRLVGDDVGSMPVCEGSGSVMKITAQAVKRLVSLGMIRVRELPRKKGAQLLFFGRRGLYVWREEERVCLQGKHFWNRKHVFKMEEIE